MTERNITSEEDRLDVASDLASLTSSSDNVTKSDIEDSLTVIEEIITPNTSQEVSFFSFGRTRTCSESLEKMNHTEKYDLS